MLTSTEQDCSEYSGRTLTTSDHVFLQFSPLDSMVLAAEGELWLANTTI